MQRQEIILATLFLILTFGLMFFWSVKTDRYVYEELSKPGVTEYHLIDGKVYQDNGTGLKLIGEARECQ